MREGLTAVLQGEIDSAVERKRVVGIVKQLFDSADFAKSMEDASDDEIAQICDELANNVGLLDPMCDILISVAGRLRRAGGGGYRQCTWCEKEATHFPVDGDQPGCDVHKNGET
jgi:hypothetical protein